MEQKDPHFNIHDYVDLSYLARYANGPELEQELLAMANDPLMKSQALFIESAQTEGRRIIVTADDNISSSYSNGVVNINFKKLETLHYETSPELATLTHENYDNFDKDYTPTYERFTLPATIWHEFAHVRHFMSPAERMLYQHDASQFKQTFDDYINATNLPDDVKTRATSLGTHALTNLLVKSDQREVERILNFSLQELYREAPEFLDLSNKMKLLNGKHIEAPAIEDTNKNVREPKGLELRILHINIHTKNAKPQPVITMTDLEGEYMPEVELMVDGICLNCENADLKDIKTPSNIPNNKPTITAELD